MARPGEVGAVPAMDVGTAPGVSDGARARLLAAAVRVYGSVGMHGATTRMLAAEAGVNEITLFRQFGSKRALFIAAVRDALRGVVVRLTEHPTHPERELTAWCAAQMAALARVRPVLRRCAVNGDEDDPVLAGLGRDACLTIAAELRGYARRLEHAGQLSDHSDLWARIAMLCAVVINDALWRADLPNCFPEPAVSAPRRYAAAFLHGVTAREPG